MSTDELRTAITTHLQSKSLYPSPTWLTTFLSTARPSTPLPALQQTALFRLLTSDLTTTLSPPPAALFPANIHDATIASRRLDSHVVPVQVLDVEDLSRSRWAQVEALEAAERGETTKGREVVRVVPGEEGLSGEENAGAGKGQHKVLLQDAKGTQVYGFELGAVEGIGVGMNIGAKLVLREVLVARGLVLLEPGTVTVLGGKIEGLQREWKEGRKRALMQAVGIEDAS
ncbi:hypothetical protein EV356DRAFT_17375 [Viridothelium virens]|uniref:RecQ-mediated genome instability protein 1 n=1 Tax=Viridothelium virens TaxID=1048519 RepID=A0A6A6HHB0_VIRVR|nr:hypothetical protein EV356DRAFT_17375 [Viridothelium virens]